MTREEKHQIVETMLQKGIKQARAEKKPLLLYNRKDGKIFDPCHSKISEKTIREHPIPIELNSVKDLDV
jgi:hypothetical protein